MLKANFIQNNMVHSFMRVSVNIPLLEGDFKIIFINFLRRNCDRPKIAKRSLATDRYYGQISTFKFVFFLQYYLLHSFWKGINQPFLQKDDCQKNSHFFSGFRNPDRQRLPKMSLITDLLFQTHFSLKLFASLFASRIALRALYFREELSNKEIDFEIHFSQFLSDGLLQSRSESALFYLWWTMPKKYYRCFIHSVGCLILGKCHKILVLLI